MTPQAAVGAGIGGLAAAGAGGTAVAYAAGAFEAKKKKADENLKETYLSKASKQTVTLNKEYIGENGQDSKVKVWMKSKEKETKYKQDLGSALESMNLTEDNKPTESTISKLKKPDNLEDGEAEITYNYTKKWCETKKETVYDPSKTEEFGIFQKICFVGRNVA
ncbi:hypothetical protein [Candidatus Mycoplasma haematohominis]|uniref:Uncharacterized protein n=1 Tax=Candidatus Mycoplasma haematohominis TaxID=1494318 RepID=A0A478FRL0_9MOLU|nr:hypothetical protein [Candidatus Mycoplasma haemohominis]GCE63059.1 hypothetical protein MHSWG343_00370 [Candidatus Mycoplasma haemohominis]